MTGTLHDQITAEVSWSGGVDVLQISPLYRDSPCLARLAHAMTMYLRYQCAGYGAETPHEKITLPFVPLYR